MKILRCEFKNFGSYGNKLHVIEMPDPAAFSLIVGANGRGKCLMPDTSIEVMLEDESELEKFKQFLSIYRQNGNNGNGKQE